MTRWEYAVVEFSGCIQKREIDMLNGDGKNGWEAYAVTVLYGRTSFHMRRPVLQSSDGREGDGST